MAANNQGIVHLRIGGWNSRKLACNRRDAHMAVPSTSFEAEPRKCVRCAAKWEKMKAISAKHDARARG